MEIALAPLFKKSALPYLKCLIKDHRDLFRVLFPDVNSINKHHLMEHLEELFEEMGQAKAYWTMGEEGKHRPLRRHMVSCNSYKDTCKTAVEYAQISQAVARGGSSKSLGNKLEFPLKGKVFFVPSLPSAQLLATNGFSLERKVEKSVVI